MNVEHLKLFVRIATTHNISKAGNELDLSPAVASAHISKLEDAPWRQAYPSNHRKVSLTEEGQAFLPHAEEVLVTIETARASVGAGSFIPQGTLRVAAPASFGRMHIIPALKGFIDKHPDLKVDLRLSDSMIDMVEGGFDVAIRNAALNDSSLVASKLAKDERIICASPDYIAQQGEPQSVADLRDHPCIHLMGIDTWQFDTPEGPKRVKGKSILRVDNGECIRDACIAGIGVTICSKWIAYKDLKAGRLVQILKNYPLVSDTAIWAVYPGSRLLAPKVRAFIDYFKGHFGSQPYWER